MENRIHPRNLWVQGSNLTGGYNRLSCPFGGFSLETLPYLSAPRLCRRCAMRLVQFLRLGTMTSLCLSCSHHKLAMHVLALAWIAIKIQSGRVSGHCTQQIQERGLQVKQLTPRPTHHQLGQPTSP